MRILLAFVYALTRIFLALALALTAAACSRHDRPAATSNDLDSLRAKAETYQSLALAVPGLIDASGFPTDDPCDAVERACFRLVGGAAVAYENAENPAVPGEWYRDSVRTCGPAAGTSASRFSRDMALGLGLCLWQAGDVQRAKNTTAYVSAHGGYLDPDAKILFTPMLSYLYGGLIAKAASTPLPARPADPDIGAQLTGVLTGSNAHLTEVGIYWDGVMAGGVSDVEMDVLKDQASRQPRNGLYQAFVHKFTDGDQAAALAVVMDETLFPADRLPTSCDRKASYLWERDGGADWEPDPATPQGQCKTWSGTDLVFLYAVVADMLRGDKVVAD